MARHDEKTSAGRAKMLSGCDIGDRLAEVDEVLGCLVVQTAEHHEAELQRDQLRYIVIYLLRPHRQVITIERLRAQPSSP